VCGLGEVRLIERATSVTSLLPQLLPFSGSNSHSVVIMDNCSVHHVSEVVKMTEEVGAMVHFLPLYSPDFNPIELAFSKVKKSLKLDGIDDKADIETALLEAFATIRLYY